jgi:hypothetical protein
MDIKQIDAMQFATRAARRQVFKTVRRELAAKDPADVLAKVARVLNPHPERRLTDPPNSGMWYPDASLNAVVSVLREAERALRRGEPRARG